MWHIALQVLLVLVSSSVLAFIFLLYRAWRLGRFDPSWED